MSHHLSHLRNTLCSISLLYINCCMANEPQSDAQASFTKMVNQHALELGMVCGERRVQDAQGKIATYKRCGEALGDDIPPLKTDDKVSCIVKVTDKLEGDAAKYPALHREILRSPLPGEVYRFNHPRAAADRALFELNPDTCEIRRYIGSRHDFRPPVMRSGQELKVRYAVEADSATEVLLLKIASQKQVRLPIRATAADQKKGHEEVNVCAATTKTKPLAKAILFIMCGNEKLAEWDHSQGISIIQNVRSGMNLKIHHPQGGVGKNGVATALPEGGKVFFPPGATLTIRTQSAKGAGVPKENSSGNVATFTRASSVIKPLFHQKANGQVAWGRIPTNFEVQIVEALRSAGDNVDQDVKLTIDPTISAELEFDLNLSMEALRSRIAADARASNTPLRNRPYYGSVAMLDAMTGDIVGIASYPQAASPEAYLNGDFRALPQREEALTRRVIGSVAKAPLSFAIIAARPELASMRLSPFDGSPINSILGRQLESPLSNHPSSACGLEVDFRCYLALSLNKYALTLMAMGALSENPRIDEGNLPLGKDAITVGERKIAYQPLGFLFGEKFNGVDGAFTELPLAKKLSDLFDIEFRFEAADPPGLHKYMWQNAMKAGAKPDSSSFAMITPEAENFQLNLIKNYRNDYLTLILGGGNSRWSAVKVAESYARMVSAKRIEASFVQAKKRNVGSLLLKDASEARTAILDGLSNVIDMSGATANWLRPEKAALAYLAKEANYELAMYAKTGTPQVDSVSDSGQIERVRASLGTVVPKRRAKDSDGHDFTYKNNIIVEQTIVEPKDNQLLDEDLIKLFARFNQKPTKAEQKAICEIIGQQVTCPDRKLETMAGDDGRNLALVVELRRGETLCRAVSMAYAHSLKPSGKDDSIWRAMVKRSLSTSGPVARYLGLGIFADTKKECGNAN